MLDTTLVTATVNTLIVDMVYISNQDHTKSLPETLYHRDNALLYIAYVMLIWAAPIPADRWHCSL